MQGQDRKLEKQGSQAKNTFRDFTKLHKDKTWVIYALTRIK